MLYTAGIDIGSLSGKCVILEQGTPFRIVSSSVVLTTPDSEETAVKALAAALGKAGIQKDDLAYVVSTGYGRVNVSFANETITEISCHAKGVHSVFPDVRTILDIGGQDCKVIRCGKTGRVEDFLMNDKCAAGTGRYLERTAATLGMKLEEMGNISLLGWDTPEEIRSYCTVFAEEDIIHLLRRGKERPNILAGACEAIVKRVMIFIRQVGILPEFSISGGVAKNIGIVKRLQRTLGMEVHVMEDPQIAGALGAAMFALEKV